MEEYRRAVETDAPAEDGEHEGCAYDPGTEEGVTSARRCGSDRSRLHAGDRTVTRTRFVPLNAATRKQRKWFARGSKRCERRTRKARATASGVESPDAAARASSQRRPEPSVDDPGGITMKITLTVNGKAVAIDADDRADAAPLRAARRPGTARTALRLRARAMRRLHCPRRRQGGALVRDAGRRRSPARKS